MVTLIKCTYVVDAGMKAYMLAVTDSSGTRVDTIQSTSNMVSWKSWLDCHYKWVLLVKQIIGIYGH